MKEEEVNLFELLFKFDEIEKRLKEEEEKIKKKRRENG